MFDDPFPTHVLYCVSMIGNPFPFVSCGLGSEAAGALGGPAPSPLR